MRRREPFLVEGTPLHLIAEYGLVLFGCLLVALSFNLFLAPNQVVSGGVTGISVLVQHATGINPAYTQWALNIPLFVLGAWLVGKQFGVKTAVGTFVVPLFVLLTSDVPSLTNNAMLAAIYGGIGIGLGVGIVLRGRGSTGGMDLAAQLIHRYTGIAFSAAMAMLDTVIILTAGAVFTPEKALYALIGLFATSKTIDVVQVGFGSSKVAYIISAKWEEMAEAVLHVLDRGLTKLKGAGGYTDNDHTVLMVVVNVREVAKLKVLVRTIDPEAFVLISSASEVLGEGFKRNG